MKGIGKTFWGAPEHKKKWEHSFDTDDEICEGEKKGEKWVGKKKNKVMGLLTVIIPGGEGERFGALGGRERRKEKKKQNKMRCQ